MLIFPSFQQLSYGTLSVFKTSPLHPFDLKSIKFNLEGVQNLSLDPHTVLPPTVLPYVQQLFDAPNFLTLLFPLPVHVEEFLHTVIVQVQPEQSLLIPLQRLASVVWVSATMAIRAAAKNFIKSFFNLKLYKIQKQLVYNPQFFCQLIVYLTTISFQLIFCSKIFQT